MNEKRYTSANYLMKKRIILCLVLCFVLIVLFGIAKLVAVHRLQTFQKLTAMMPTAQSHIDHIVIISMENKSYSDIIGSSDAPYLNSLIKNYTLADNYFAVSHPSLPNYIALTGGSTFTITSDCTDCFLPQKNIVDQLEQSQKTWKAYMESMPSSCFIGDSDPYAQRHNPFIYFDDIRTNQNRCRNIVPYDHLAKDFSSLASTPNYAWISPNLCDDMHSCPVATGDTWLSEQVPHLLSSPAFQKQNSLLVITWDEGETTGSNQIPTVFVGNMVKKGFVTHTHYTHYSLLATIEHIWHMPFLTDNIANSMIIGDIFR